ncbi:MAG TPA: LLM class flavin-dependent oxidoreductase [Candidatus Dormibacteraeota bacterium]|nr:LLM class flavin-dependent oxidoreductase [Candidatus Dormibacteraeota bacterium]
MRAGVVLGVAGLPLRRSLDLAVQAEAAGCDTLAAGEATYDSVAVCGLLASATRRTRIMTTVMTWARPPVAAALGAITLAEIAEGRFALGLGTMPAAWSRDHYGIDPGRSVSRLREYVACLRGALSATPGRPFFFDGEFFKVREYSRTWPPPCQVAIHLAATRPRMARLAGEVAEGVLYNVIHTRAWLHDVLEPSVTASGRRIERGAMLRVVPHADGGRERALEQARIAVAPYVEVPYLADVLAHHGWSPEAATGPALEELVLVGTVPELLGRLEPYRELVDWVLLAPPRMLREAEMEAWYETVLGELLPALRVRSAAARLESAS